ncbi:hypothetical protein WBP07_27615 [Novosphingobium sp. BL-8A]|uniref:hypothetical protein n=1 Tax=Novosphingobium sp. BL-8A TaxID=3127639 RepID=UPI003757BF67
MLTKGGDDTSPLQGGGWEVKFSIWILAALVFLSFGSAYFLSAWGPEPMYLMYIPNNVDDVDAIIGEALVLSILYSPALYLFYCAVRSH